MLIVHPGRTLRIDLESGLATLCPEQRGVRLTNFSRLGRRERNVLAYLARRPNQVVSRQELQKAVFGDRKNSTASLTHAVAQIRQVLTSVERGEKCLITIYGEGYLFAPAKSGLKIVPRTDPAFALHAQWQQAGVQ
jgi:DNA-binding winged helix-turn-helix (wHTH) protein